MGSMFSINWQCGKESEIVDIDVELHSQCTIIIRVT